MAKIIVMYFFSFYFLVTFLLILLVRSNSACLPALERENCVQYWYIYPMYILTFAYILLPVAFFYHLIRLYSVK